MPHSMYYLPPLQLQPIDPRAPSWNICMASVVTDTNTYSSRPDRGMALAETWYRGRLAGFPGLWEVVAAGFDQPLGRTPRTQNAVSVSRLLAKDRGTLTAWRL
jgi:hypothetical protein